MPYTPTELMLIKGLPSSTSLGNPGVTDLVPKAYDFLAGVFTIFDENSNSTFSPTIATIKNGGVWVDSALMDGRQLVAAKRENVEEVMLLRAGPEMTVMQRSVALSDLNEYATAADEYWSSGGISDPVYLRFWAPGAPAEQYALIYTIKIDDDNDGLNPEGNGTITVSIEREPAWRPIPPGANPKLWAFHVRGLQPMQDFDYADLSLTDFNNANPLLRHFSEKQIRSVDEILTTNVNYIDLPAADCVGDAPGLLQLILTSASGIEMNFRNIFARSTIRDLYPANNNNSTTQKMRNTFNGGDATLGTGVGITNTKQVDAANGALSNGSTVTRYILRSVSVAGGHASLTVGRWDRVALHYARKWQVFVRYRVTAGNPASIQLRCTMQDLTWGAPTISSSWRPLTGTASALWKGAYIATIDTTAIARRNWDGTGLYPGTMSVYLSSLKANDGVASTLEILDMALVPLDEPSVSASGVSPNERFGFDNTGYSGLEQTLINPFGDQLNGQPLTYVPGVANRIYYWGAPIGGSNADEIYNFAINIVPRWYGVRDV